ncbi:putative integral membrane protein [Theileria parva strain Muguga]|uniref:Uncharacterized protein n=1 Tax=Theileria parva TaxID=5875 RepID=Q4MYX0_THEPA|nr:putative integral membrane protein [Theileria parva strain Muguga]EAN30562.1 putative integral membrane protein [Theileria parva strain Muguga]|eukprot:XP_762845.1 hypothetical protein [Theileria parva strain Muguga]
MAYLSKLATFTYKIKDILETVNCCCVCCHKTIFNDIYKESLKDILNNHKKFNPHSQLYMTKIIENYGNHLCLCLVIDHLLLPTIEITTGYFVDIVFDFLYNICRIFDKYSYTTRQIIDISKFILLLIVFIYKIVISIEKRYLCKCDRSTCCKGGNRNSFCTCCSPKKVQCCYCAESKADCNCCCKENNKKCCPERCSNGRNCECCRCCCICFCRSSNDPNYYYFVSLILYLSHFLEEVFTFDNETIRIATEYLSSLISEFDLMDYKKIIKKLDKIRITKLPEKIKMLISTSTDISTLILQNNNHTLILSILSRYQRKLVNGSIKNYYETFALVPNVAIISPNFTLFYQDLSGLTHFIINSNEFSLKTKIFVKRSIGIVSSKYLEAILNRRKSKTQCCQNKNCKFCKIICNSVCLISGEMNIISSQVLSTLTLCIVQKSDKLLKLTKLLFENFNQSIGCNKDLIIYTKNSRISESTHGLLYERDGNFDHINPKYFGYDDVYRPSPQFGSGYFKFVISRVFTVIVLVVLFIFIRTRFDRFVNTDIFGRYLIKVDSNIGRLREVLHNRLSHSVRNISRMGSLDDLLGDMSEGDVGHNLVFHHPERYQDVIDNMGMADMGHYDAMSDIDTLSDTFTDTSFDGTTKAVQESRRRKVGFYILIIVFSLLSALYLNFVVRDLSVMLQLDHTTWSYFISITVLMGMIISLVVKYCVHLYDFVYVLENYSNKLTKIESFVDDSFGGVTGNLTYTSKFVLLFQLMRSMKTDLVSLFSMNYPYQIPAHSLMKNKVYPYKDMTGGMERMMTCENIECIRRMVLDSIGTPESMDLQNVLDFVSYVTVRNTAEFDQYRGYFSGNERYLAWRLGKLLGHNFFLLTYGRYSCMLEMDHRIRKLRIPSAQFLNCQFLWQLFGNYESDLISLKCLGVDSIGIPLTHVQKDVLKNKFADEYLDAFKKYQDFLIRKLHIKASKCYDSPSCYFPYPELINGTLDRDKVTRLTREYFGDSSRRLSLSLPTTNCDVTKKVVNGKGAESPGVSVTQFCDHWLYMRLGCCETEDCEKGVRFAHDLIMSKLNGDSDVFESIKDTVASLKLSILNTEETYETPEDIHVPVKSSEHRSLKDYTYKLNEFRYQTTDTYQDTVLDYLNRYMIETMTNREKIMVPLGIFLTWYGIPVCEQHLRNMGKFQYLI